MNPLILLLSLALTAMTVVDANHLDCPPQLAIGKTYAEQKLACPYLATQAFDADDDTKTAFYLCPSQHVVIVGSVRTGKTVALMGEVRPQ